MKKNKNMYLGIVLLAISLFSPVSMFGEKKEQSNQNIIALSHIALISSNMEKTKAFYHDFLGYDEQLRLNYIAESKLKGSLMLVSFKVNDYQFLEVFTGYQPGMERIHQYAFRVTDADKIHDELEKNGVKLREDVMTGQMKNHGFCFEEPNDYTVEIMEYTPKGFTYSNIGKYLSDKAISKHLLHASIVIKDKTKSDLFYDNLKDLQKSVTKSGIRYNIKGTDEYVEYMSDQKAAPHFCLEVKNVDDAIATLNQRKSLVNYTKSIEKYVDSEGNQCADVYDPEGVRVELMEKR